MFLYKAAFNFYLIWKHFSTQVSCSCNMKFSMSQNSRYIFIFLLTIWKKGRSRRGYIHCRYLISWINNIFGSWDMFDFGLLILERFVLILKFLKCNNLVNLSIFSPFIAFLFALLFNLNMGLVRIWFLKYGMSSILLVT